MIQANFTVVQRLLEFMNEIIPSAWTVSYCKDVPSLRCSSDSAALMCLNIACFALTIPRINDINVSFGDTFAYNSDAKFVK